MEDESYFPFLIFHSSFVIFRFSPFALKSLRVVMAKGSVNNEK